jgi:flagellar hook-length control protein FliK
VQSVASISPPDPLPTPAPDRKEKGSDSFSLLLDAAAKPPDNSAPEAGPPAGEESSSPPRKAESRPADDPSAQPQDDPGKTGASCERSGGDVSKDGEATTKEKNSGKSPKQSAKDGSAKDPAQAVVAPDPAQGVPQTGSVPAVVVAPDPAQGVPQTGSVPALVVAVDVPKVEGGGNASAGGDCAKVAAAEIAAMAPAVPAAPDAAKPSAETAPPANAGAAIAAAAIEAATKGASASPPRDAAAAEDAAKGAASAVPATKALAEALKPAVASVGGEPNPKPLAADKAASGNAPVQPAPASAEEGKPPSPVDPATVVRFTAKAAPAGANQDLEAAVARDVSAAPQPATTAEFPEALRVLVSTLGPASAPVQAPGASALGVPATSAAIAVEIAARAKEGSNQFTIRLDPPELGRIDVRLDVDKSGAVNTRLTVDRPETLQLLQNDARGLERALQSAGLKTEDGSLQFSLRQQSPDGSAGQQAQGGPDPRSGTVYVEEDEAASAGLEQYQWAARLRGGVDIRV